VVPGKNQTANVMAIPSNSKKHSLIFNIEPKRLLQLKIKESKLTASVNDAVLISLINYYICTFFTINN
jgi:hypothetical protein